MRFLDSVPTTPNQLLKRTPSAVRCCALASPIVLANPAHPTPRLTQC